MKDLSKDESTFGSRKEGFLGEGKQYSPRHGSAQTAEPEEHYGCTALWM